LTRVEDDLPNPLEASGTPETTADDLLAQLAGEEVDRLLADADIERPKAPAGTPSASVVDEESARALEDMLNEAAQREPSPAPPPPAVTAESAPAGAVPSTAPSSSTAPIAAAKGSTSANEDLSAQLDDLFAALNEAPNSSAPAAAAPPPPAAPAKPVAAPVPTPSEPAMVAPSPTSPATPVEAKHGVDPASGTGATEKAALREAAIGEPLLEPAALLEALPSATPWWIKPLEWINAPFEFVFEALPENARDFVGKAGIMTLLFALGILAYAIWRGTN
jgi:hypothetical protein